MLDPWGHQHKLAMAMLMVPGEVMERKRGRRTITAHFLVRYALTGLSVHWLLTGDGESGWPPRSCAGQDMGAVRTGFWERLGLLRGWRSAAAIAVRMGITRQGLSQLKHKRSIPGVEALTSLARCERVNLDWLLTGSGDSHIAAPPSQRETEVA